MKININLKNIIKYLILFILACIFIYYSSILNVKAESSTFNINSFDITYPTTIYWLDNINGSYQNYGNYNSIISITSFNDTLAFSTPSRDLLTSNGGTGATLAFNTTMLQAGHSYYLYVYLLDISNIGYSPYYSSIRTIDTYNQDFSVATSQLVNFLSAGQKSQFGDYYLYNMIYGFTVGSSNQYGVQIHFSSSTSVTFTPTMPNRGFIGYKLLDVTNYSTSTIEGMIQDNQNSLNAIEEDVTILQQTQEETNNKIDEQIQQDKEQHEAEMEQDKQQHEEQMESQLVCRKEIIDKNNIATNGFLDINGTLVESQTDGVTNYIEIDENTKIKQLQTWEWSYSCFYDSNKTKISCFQNNLAIGTYITIPDNAKYLRVSIQKSVNKPQYELTLCKNGNQALNDSLNNSDTSGANQDANNFFNNFENNDFGLSDIITLPLTTIQSITSKSCTPLSLTLPFVNKTFELPCMNTIYSKFEPFYSIYQTITFGVISYWVCVQIYAMVKGFKDPTSDEIEVMDL